MKLTVREMAVFSMLGAVMYASKVIMDAAPNIHLLGMFIVAFTVVYRKKALYPIYIFVLLTGGDPCEGLGKVQSEQQRLRGGVEYAVQEAVKGTDDHKHDGFKLRRQSAW